LRKLLTVAVAASAILSLAVGVAVAQAPAQGTFTASVTPSKSGKKKKPKSVKATFDVKVTTENATADTIELKLGKGLKFSGKGFRRCNADDLSAGGLTACPAGSKAGPVGVANALVGPATSPVKAPLNFDVSTFVENDTSILFYLNQQGGGVQRVIKGKISGKGSKLTITVPLDLRRPGGVDASLVGLTQSFSGKSGKHYIVSSTGCTGKKWKLNAKITFAARADGTPVPGPLVGSTTAKCKK
jgi:hypothetical protein